MQKQYSDPLCEKNKRHGQAIYHLQKKETGSCLEMERLSHCNARAAGKPLEDNNCNCLTRSEQDSSPSPSQVTVNAARPRMGPSVLYHATDSYQTSPDPDPSPSLARYFRHNLKAEGTGLGVGLGRGAQWRRSETSLAYRPAAARARSWSRTLLGYRHPSAVTVAPRWLLGASAGQSGRAAE